MATWALDARLGDASGYAAKATTDTRHTCTRPGPSLPRKNKAAGVPSLRPSTQGNDLDRFEHDQQIQSQRSVLDVVKVVLQLFPRIGKGVAILVSHLRPARDTGTHRQPH